MVVALDSLSLETPSLVVARLAAATILPTLALAKSKRDDHHSLFTKLELSQRVVLRLLCGIAAAGSCELGSIVVFVR